MADPAQPMASCDQAMLGSSLRRARLVRPSISSHYSSHPLYFSDRSFVYFFIFLYPFGYLIVFLDFLLFFWTPLSQRLILSSAISALSVSLW